MRLGSLARWGIALVRDGSEAIRWKEFEKWLFVEYKPRIARQRLNYARRYADSLIKRDLTELRSLSLNKRLHVMKALSALAKFLGIYEEWKTLVKNNGLKWCVNNDDLIISRLTKNRDSNEVFTWIKEVKKAKPSLAGFMDFMTISGLRLIEALESYNLIIKLAKEGKLNEYYNREREVLEHFRFKEIFIRKTKKAFMSFVPRSLVDRISHERPLTTSYAISLRKKGFKCRFGDIREAHGTFLTKYLNQSEIDFLHGRISGSVFMRNYFNPALITDLKARTFQGINEMLSLS